MKFLRLFKKYRELESKCERLENECDELSKLFEAAHAKWKMLKGDLDIAQKELAAARAKLQSPSPAATVANAAPKLRPHKVPHCSECKHHERFNNAGKHMHKCDKVGRMVSGNDTRTSPPWCPLRGNGEGEQT